MMVMLFFMEIKLSATLLSKLDQICAH